MWGGVMLGIVMPVVAAWWCVVWWKRQGARGAPGVNGGCHHMVTG